MPNSSAVTSFCRCQSKEANQTPNEELFHKLTGGWTFCPTLLRSLPLILLLLTNKQRRQSKLTICANVVSLSSFLAVIATKLSNCYDQGMATWWCECAFLFFKLRPSRTKEQQQPRARILPQNHARLNLKMFVTTKNKPCIISITTNEDQKYFCFILGDCGKKSVFCI